MKTLAVINSSAPYGRSNYRESLDLLLANASYDRPVALFFFGDGLYQLLDNQAPQEICAKDTSKMFGLLDLYDIEHIYFCHQSLNERNINPDSLIVEGEVLAPVKWFATLATFDQVVNF